MIDTALFQTVFPYIIHFIQQYNKKYLKTYLKCKLHIFISSDEDRVQMDTHMLSEKVS